MTILFDCGGAVMSSFVDMIVCDVDLCGDRRGEYVVIADTIPPSKFDDVLQVFNFFISCGIFLVEISTKGGNEAVGGKENSWIKGGSLPTCAERPDRGLLREFKSISSMWGLLQLCRKGS